MNFPSVFLYTIFTSWGANLILKAFSQDRFDTGSAIMGLVIIAVCIRQYHKELKQNYQFRVLKNKFIVHSYERYCEQFPSSHNGNGANISCNRCNCRSVISDDVYALGCFTKFACKRCGNVLFYTKQWD